jgi:hypothetical protein
MEDEVVEVVAGVGRSADVEVAARRWGEQAEFVIPATLARTLDSGPPCPDHAPTAPSLAVPL